MDVEGLVAMAVRQHGAFRWSQAIGCGWTTRAATAAVRSKEWLPLCRGAYVARELWAAMDARARHRCLVAGKMLTKDERWVAARRSAAVVHGLPMLGEPPSVAQLLRGPDGGRAKARNRHERIATFTDAERVVVDGIDVSCLARTVVDNARAESFPGAVIMAEGALRRGLEKEELMAMARRCSTWPGGMQALRVAKHADGLAETALESLSWAGLPALGLPQPERQIRVYLGDRQIARVDGLWRQYNTIGQADGAYKYKDRQGVLYDKHQDEMLEDLGFEIARWGWEQAWRPVGVLDERLKRAFARGERQQIDPRVRLVPTSLEQSLRWTGLIAS